MLETADLSSEEEPDNMSQKIFSQEPQEYNNKLAEALKGVAEFKAPDWANFVKTGVNKERVPEDVDFWYKRAASILRNLYLHGIVGVGKFRTRYGGRKRRGGRPDEFRKASGKMIRIILQQGEAAGLVEKVAKGKQFGRRLTQAGRDFLDGIEIKEVKKVVVEKKIEKPKEEVKVEEVKSEVEEDGKQESKSKKQ